MLSTAGFCPSLKADANCAEAMLESRYQNGMAARSALQGAPRGPLGYGFILGLQVGLSACEGEQRNVLGAKRLSASFPAGMQIALPLLRFAAENLCGDFETHGDVEHKRLRLGLSSRVVQKSRYCILRE